MIFGLQKAPLPYRFLDGITVVKHCRTAHYVVAYPTDGKTDGMRMVVRGGSASARAVVTAWWLEGSLGSCSQREAEFAMAEREADGCDGAGREGPGRPRTPPPFGGQVMRLIVSNNSLPRQRDRGSDL